MSLISLLFACNSDPEPKKKGDDSDVVADSGLEDTGPTFPDAYTDVVWDAERIVSNGSEPNFQNLRADIDFHDGPFERVTLVIDLSTTCFPWEQWNSNPPPAGQNWPADCDAFDRNFEFTIDDPEQDGDPPAFEVLRAITPFGGPMHIEVDVTDLANAHPGAHRLRAHITTWSDGAGQVSGSNGGWNVSTSIDAVPGEPPRNVLAAIPVLNVNHGASTVPDDIQVDIPKKTTSTRLEYRVTGHGGADSADEWPTCIGPADEFCRRQHRIYVDDEQIDLFVPWRDDCDQLCTITSGSPFGSYCAENPCGAVQSVEAPRANWCPGDVTPPIVYEGYFDEPGKHDFRYDIADVRGSWHVSAILYAYGD